MKKLRRLLFALATLLALSGIALGVLMWTSMGLPVAVSLAESFADLTLSSQKLEGNLAHGITAEQLGIELPGISVNIQDLSSSWQIGISDRRFTLDTLKIGSVRVVMAQAQSENEQADSPSLVELPEIDFGIALDLTRIAIDEIEWILGDAPPGLIENLDTSISLADGVLEVSQLFLLFEPLNIGASLRVDTANGYQHQISAEAMLDGQPLSIMLAGDLEQTVIEASASAWSAEVNGKLVDLLTQPGVDLRITSTMEPIDANLRVHGSLPRLMLNGTVLSGEHLASLQQISIELDEESVMLGGQLAVDPVGLTVSIDQATLGLAADGPIEVSTSWGWTAVDAGPIGPTQGTLRASGTLDDLLIVANGLIPFNKRPFELDLEAQLGPEQAVLRALSLAGEGAEIRLDGDFGWGQQLSATLSGSILRLNPEWVTPGFPGSINAQLEIAGNDQEFRLQINELNGRFLDHPLSGNVDATITDLQQVAASLLIQSGDNRIQVEVPQWPGETANIDLSIIDLGAFVPGLTGHTMATAAVTQHPDGLVIEADLDGADMVFDVWNLDELIANAAIDLRPGKSSVVNLNLGAISGPVVIESTVLGLSGRDNSFEFYNTMVSELGESRISGSINLSGNPKVAVRQLDLDTHQLGQWRLAGPLELEFAPDHIIMAETTCVGTGDARICVGLPGADGTPGQLQLKSFPFELVDGLLSTAAGQPLQLDGILNSDFQWQLLDGQPVINGYLSNDGLKVTLGSDEELQSIELTDWHLELDGERDLQVDLELNTRNGSISAGGKVSQWANPDLARLFIDLGVDIPDLASLGLPLKGVEDLQGDIDATIRVRGSLDAPALDGRASLQGFRLSVPSVGTSVKHGKLDLDFEDNGKVVVDGRFDLKEGFLDVTGEARFVPGEALTADIRLQADNALLVRQPTARLQADLDLHLLADETAISVIGDIGVRNTQIELGPVSQSFSPSADVVFVNQDIEEETQLSVPLVADIKVQLLDPVSIKGFGLEAEMTGGIQLSDGPSQPTLATGNLDLGGTYSIYGQTLKISKGRIVFSHSSVTDPLLDIEATRKTNEVLAGVRVSGPVTQPVVTFFSSPSMPESDIISVLVFGYALSDPNQAEAGAMSAALMTLRMGTSGVRKGRDSTLKQKLGFDEFGVDVQDDLGGAAFSVGRYLSPKLYVSYSMGLQENLSILSLRYELTKRWTLGVEAGETTRTGVGYRIETDRFTRFGSTAEGEEKTATLRDP